MRKVLLSMLLAASAAAHAVTMTSSNLIQYQPPGNGSVARTVQSKFQDMPSVLDYGADATGVNDSYAAFVAAASAGATIDVPYGTYRLSQNPYTALSKSQMWRIAPGTTFTGTGASSLTSFSHTYTNGYNTTAGPMYNFAGLPAPIGVANVSQGISAELLGPSSGVGNQLLYYMGADSNNNTTNGNAQEILNLVQNVHNADLVGTNSIYKPFEIDLQVDVSASGAAAANTNNLLGMLITGGGAGGPYQAKSTGLGLITQRSTGAWTKGIAVTAAQTGIEINASTAPLKIDTNYWGNATDPVCPTGTNPNGCTIQYGLLFDNAPYYTGTTIAGGQLANGNDAIVIGRYTDSSPTGNYMRFRNKANNSDVFQFATNGQQTIQSTGANAQLYLNAPTGNTSVVQFGLNGSYTGSVFSSSTAPIELFDNVNSSPAFFVSGSGVAAVGETGKAITLNGTTSILGSVSATGGTITASAANSQVYLNAPAGYSAITQFGINNSYTGSVGSSGSQNIYLFDNTNSATAFGVSNAGVVTIGETGKGVTLNGSTTISGTGAAFTATGLVTTTDLATQAANTILANATASSASPTAIAVPSCSTSSSALAWTTSSGLTCNSAINAATLGGATFASPGPIGATTPSTGAFTTLATTGAATVNSLATGGALIGGGSINNTTVGATTPSTGSFTTLAASGTVSGAGFTTLLSPYAVLAGPTFTAATKVSYSGANLAMNDTSGTTGASVSFTSNGTNLWGTGSSSGNAWVVSRFVSGTYTDSPISIANSSGVVTLIDGLMSNKATTVSYSGGTIYVNDTGSSKSQLVFQNNGTTEWDWSNSTASSNTFALDRFVSGTYSDSPISVSNSTGVVSLSDGLTTPAATFTGPVTIGYNTALLSLNDTSGTNQSGFYLQSNGTNVWSVKNTSGSTGAFYINRYNSNTVVDQPIQIANSTGIVTMPDGLVLKGTTVLPNLPGTTGSIGGSALAAGACTSGTVAVTNSTTSMAVVATPATYPGDGIFWHGYVSAAGTVTVKVCATTALTPTASVYNVRVHQ